MMTRTPRRIILLILSVLIASWGTLTVTAQETPQPAPAYRGVVDFESVIVRVLPLPDAEPAASVFQNNSLEVVGRSLDGTWFEVRRPGRLNNLGWIFHEMLEYDFLPENLPLTDLTTGQTGSTALSEDPGFAVYVNENVLLRTRPYYQGDRITTIEASSILPVLTRDPAGEWFKVNYLGNIGWIAGFATRGIPNVDDVPVEPGLPPLQSANVVIIAPEIQLAQVERLRGYIVPLRDYADGMATFWLMVSRGEILPCNSPAFLDQYQYGNQDIQQLPELQRYAPRANQGITYLNDSIAPLQECGLIDRRATLAARNDAINARIIFDATLGALKNLEDEVIR
ncbi:MAG: hypothetical protein K8L99_35050 [Anaerolineae bacterium]|nr:hypothetical protein [Anaerolineae bacterium]